MPGIGIAIAMCPKGPPFLPHAIAMGTAIASEIAIAMGTAIDMGTEGQRFSPTMNAWPPKMRQRIGRRR